jgi:hypothetical protein
MRYTPVIMGGLNNYFFPYFKRKKVVISLVLAHKGAFKNIVFKSALIIFMVVFLMSCAGKKGFSVVKQTIPKTSAIGIIIDSRNEIKNNVIAQFMEKGYKVKAVNASDLYTLSDAFTIKDYKHIAYLEPQTIQGSFESVVTPAQKSYDNVYKLHVFNYESQKAEMLNDMKNKWGIKYLVILQLYDWEKVSWARVIDLESFEVIAIENYPGLYSDKIDSIVAHFLNTIGSK